MNWLELTPIVLTTGIFLMSFLALLLAGFSALLSAKIRPLEENQLRFDKELQEIKASQAHFDKELREIKGLLTQLVAAGRPAPAT